MNTRLPWCEALTTYTLNTFVHVRASTNARAIPSTLKARINVMPAPVATIRHRNNHTLGVFKTLTTEMK